MSRTSTVTVVTPWLDHPELLAAYARAVERADEVIIIDNGSVDRPDYPAVNWKIIDNSTNVWFTEASNQGLALATGDVVLMLNNDVRAEPEWIDAVREMVEPGGLYGQSIAYKALAGVSAPMPYVEGWCIAAARATWKALGGWDEVAYPRPYWEDVDLSFRASVSGMSLYRCPWKIEHLSNTTSRETPGAYDYSATNGDIFARRLADYLSERSAHVEAVA